MGNKNVNGVEPPIGSFVYASEGLCPSRVLWERVGEGWRDKHGCTEKWENLVEPIDTLPPE